MQNAKASKTQESMWLSNPKYNTMLKTIAKERGIKLGWIAERAEIEPTKFSRIANGVQLPDVVEGMRIAKVLGVDVKELWPLEEGRD